MNRLRAVLDASARFTNFATEYLRDHKITGRLRSDPAGARRIPGLRCRSGAFSPAWRDWSAERDFVTNRLKTEIFNQAFGVEAGDEVEAQRDPVILKALEVLGL